MMKPVCICPERFMRGQHMIKGKLQTRIHRWRVKPIEWRKWVVTKYRSGQHHQHPLPYESRTSEIKCLSCGRTWRSNAKYVEILYKRDNMSQGTISDSRLRTICRAGQGASCCRYIVAGKDGITCAKHTELRTEIDKRVASGLFVAHGDNCDGLIAT